MTLVDREADGSHKDENRVEGWDLGVAVLVRFVLAHISPVSPVLRCLGRETACVSLVPHTHFLQL